MTSAQTLSTHPSFSSKPTLLQERTTHNFSNTRALEEHETLFSKAVSNRSPSSNPAASRTSLRVRDPVDHASVKSVAPKLSESIKKNESPQTSSESTMLLKNNSLPNKSITKSEQLASEDIPSHSDKACELPRSRKTSEDNIGYNTRKQVRSSGYPPESEDSKSQTGTKKSTGDPQQAAGYHLRTKSGHRDVNFYDSYEYEYPGRYAAYGDIHGGYPSTMKTKGQKGAISGGNSGIGGNSREMTSSRTQRTGALKNSRQEGLLDTIMCTEEMPSIEVQEDVQGKGKMGKASCELSCAEELEEENVQQDDASESVESGARSPSVTKEGNKRKAARCLNKLCMTDGGNPALWAKEKVKGRMICKTCWEAYQREQYCHYCSQIYLDDDSTTANDDKDWIGCDACGRWNHIQCETAHGLRNLASLLRRDKSYKYFCPQCRNKNSRKVTAPTGNTQDRSVMEGSVSPSQEPSQAYRRKTQNSRNEHQRPLVDDWLACEEGLEEPSLVKVRINDNKEAVAEVSQNGEEEEKVEEEDVVKKRLDALFSRTSTRRRHLHQRPAGSVLECFGEVEKLLSQYGGKRMQLTEHEIKADLLQIREMSKVNSVQGNSEPSVSEMEVVETVEEGAGEEADDLEIPPLEKGASKNRGSRAKQQRKPLKGREVNRAQKVQTILKEERSLMGNGKDKEGSALTGRMNLRTRKAY